MLTTDEVSVVVNRGAESWQFFAFVFAAICGLGVSLIDDLAERTVLKIPAKLGWFVCSFYIFMVNAWVGNQLVMFLTWLKRQPQ
jgi:uncharacterized membrane protein